MNMYHIKCMTIAVATMTMLCVLSACGGSAEGELTDPIATYSIIKEDTSGGIDIISLSGNNPLRVRAEIEKYVIPEATYEAQRSVLYAMLDTLYNYMHHPIADTCVAEDRNAVIDSLNYMVVHYMKHMLQDKKSVGAPLKHKMLKTVFTADRALRIYSWNENIGLDYNTYLNVYQYADANRLWHACLNECEYNAATCEIKSGMPVSVYKMSGAKDGEQVYLLNVEGNMSSQEYYKGSLTLKLQNDSLIFDYSGFSDNTPVYMYEYLHGESVMCSYNYKMQQLVYKIKNANGETNSIIYDYNHDYNIFELKQD